MFWLGLLHQNRSGNETYQFGQRRFERKGSAYVVTGVEREIKKELWSNPESKTVGHLTTPNLKGLRFMETTQNSSSCRGRAPGKGLAFR